MSAVHAALSFLLAQAERHNQDPNVVRHAGRLLADVKAEAQATPSPEVVTVEALDAKQTMARAAEIAKVLRENAPVASSIVNVPKDAQVSFTEDKK